MKAQIKFFTFLLLFSNICGFSQTAYIANQLDNTVSVINTSNMSVVSTIAVGQAPVGVTVSRDGSKVYVSNIDSGDVSVINTATNTVSATITGLNNPYGLALNSDGSKLYVTSITLNTVSVINTLTNSIVATIPVRENPRGIVITPDGSKAYVSNYFTNRISVLDLVANVVSETVNTGDANPMGMVFSPYNAKLYFTHGLNLSILDTNTNTIINTIPLNVNLAYALAMSPDGSKIYISYSNSNLISVFNTATNTIIGSIYSGASQGLSITPDGSKLYATSQNQNSVHVINTSNNTVSNTISVGRYPVSFGNFISTHNSSYVNTSGFTRFLPYMPSDGYPISPAGNCAPIVRTQDGGYLLHYGYTARVSGYIYESSSHIVKTDDTFVPLWRKALPGWNGKKTLAFNDGSFILFSNTSNTYNQYYPYYDRNSRFRIEKISADGQNIWAKVNQEPFEETIGISDGFIKNTSTVKFAGSRATTSTLAHPLLMDFDLNGNFLQGFTLEGQELPNGTIESISNDEFGNYYVLISRDYHINAILTHKKYVAKLSDSNTILWCKRIDFTNSNYKSDKSYSESIVILGNGDLMIGSKIIQSNLNSSHLTRISSNGDLIWSKSINNVATQVNSLKEISQNEIIGSGLTDYSIDGRNLIFKIDGEGNLIWSKKYGKSFAISQLYQKDPNDWYFAAHYRSNDRRLNQPILFNVDSNGNSECIEENAVLNLTTAPVVLTSIQLTSTPIILATTDYTPFQKGDQSFFNECTTLSTTEFKDEGQINIFPNPSNGLINVVSKNNINKLMVYNFIGQEIKKIQPNEYNFSFIIENPGIYVIKIETEVGNKIFKVIVK